MKNIFKIALVVLISLTTLNADTALQKIVKKGTIILGTSGNMTPMTRSINNGKDAVGFDIDLAKALGEELGVPVEFTSSSWEGIFTGLTAKQYDVIISSVSMTKGRMATMDYSIPYRQLYSILYGDVTENKILGDVTCLYQRIRD